MMRWMAVALAMLSMMTMVTGCGDSQAQPHRADEVAEIHLTGDDQMQFNLDEFTVTAGQTVRLTLEHIGDLPVSAMGHNVVILKQGESYENFGSKALENGSLDNDYVPAALLDRVVAHTKLVGGGETTQIEFTAPQPGKYPYLCTFPGHFVMMHGTMIVEAAK